MTGGGKKRATVESAVLEKQQRTFTTPMNYNKNEVNRWHAGYYWKRFNILGTLRTGDRSGVTETMHYNQNGMTVIDQSPLESQIIQIKQRECMKLLPATLMELYI